MSRISLGRRRGRKAPTVFDLCVCGHGVPGRILVGPLLLLLGVFVHLLGPRVLWGLVRKKVGNIHSECRRSSQDLMKVGSSMFDSCEFAGDGATAR